MAAKMDLSNFYNHILFQIAYTNNLDEIEKDRTLRAIRDGNCTHIIKNLKMNRDSKESILRTIAYFMDIAYEINNAYFSIFNTSFKNEYFYVYRFISVKSEFFGKNILYPSMISTSWNLEFVKNWALDDSNRFREGMFQKIKVSRRSNFLTSSCPINRDIWIENYNSIKKYFMKIDDTVLETFKEQNDIIKSGLGKNKSKYELINQLEGEVVLPPGKMNFIKVSQIDEFELFEYEFFETPKEFIVDNIDYCIEKGTIL
tara:strand:- start:15 stop:788 length:774 start_codon:yes stop_codon:yes gene_type:complete